MKSKKLDKRIIYGIGGVVLLVLVVLLLTSHKTMKCTSTSKQKDYTLETQYTVKAVGNKVKKVNIKETITSKDDKILEKYENQLKEQYEYNKKTYGGYSFKVTNKNGKVKSNVDINYKRFDMKKFIENNEAMKTYSKNNKFTLDGAKKLYESTGATCK